MENRRVLGFSDSELAAVPILSKPEHVTSWKAVLGAFHYWQSVSNSSFVANVDASATYQITYTPSLDYDFEGFRVSDNWQWCPVVVNNTIATSGVVNPEIQSEPTTITQLTGQVGIHRKIAKFNYEDESDRHRDVLYREWQSRSATRGKTAPLDMLDELSELGFAWRDTARMLGVSVPAVQKWRRGDGVTGANRRKIAELLAMCDMIAEHFMINEVASWFEMPLVSECPVAPINLYAERRSDLVFEYASDNSDPEQVLSEFDPDWRERYRSSYEVFTATDGELAIRPKAR